MRAAIRAIPPRTPMTIPAMEPPLNFELLAALVLADEESEPEPAVETEPGTVIVLTWPPELVCVERVAGAVVVSSDEVD
jgi:hypothetical protein